MSDVLIARTVLMCTQVVAISDADRKAAAEAELSRLRREKYKRGINKLMKLNRMNSFFSGSVAK